MAVGWVLSRMCSAARRAVPPQPTLPRRASASRAPPAVPCATRRSTTPIPLPLPRACVRAPCVRCVHAVSALCTCALLGQTDVTTRTTRRGARQEAGGPPAPAPPPPPPACVRACGLADASSNRKERPRRVRCSPARSCCFASRSNSPRPYLRREGGEERRHFNCMDP